MVAVAALVAVTGCRSDQEPTSDDDGSGAPANGVVEFVIDGDTIDVTIGGQVERVRLIGVDTPESVSRDTPVQCFGREAGDALRSLLPAGTDVRLERDIEIRDRFDRLLLYVYRAEDDLFVNRWLLEEGLADVLFFEPNVTFRADFTAVRDGARRDQHGLWGACDGADQPLE